MTYQYRQGDVLLLPVDEIPPGAKPQSATAEIVLAYGEQTGHKHSIKSRHAESFIADGSTFISTRPGAELTHQEHFPIKLKPGVYKVVLQRQYAGEPITTSTYSPDWNEYMD